MTNQSTNRLISAVKASQLILAGAADFNLVADGYWGKTTQSVYDNAPPRVRAAVDNVLSTFDTTAKMVRDLARIQVRLDPDYKRRAVEERSRMLISSEEARRIVAEVAAAEGVPPETALRICYVESKFNPYAVSKTGARGLFQFTSIAIKDVADRGSPPFDLRGREFDAKANATAGMRYIKILARDLRVPLNDYVSIYIAFNIGPTGARNLLKGNLDAKTISNIKLQAYGDPGDYRRNVASALSNANIAVA